jgi:diguanylate cyclase (GGDEF)-like protein
MLMPTLNTWFYGAALGGALEAADRVNCRVVAIQTSEAGKRVEGPAAEPYQARAAWERMDAFIVTVGAVPDEYVQELDRFGRPVVLLATGAVPGVSCPLIVADNRGGILSAIDHLMEHGHRRIGYVARDFVHPDDLIRQAAYHEAMVARGLDPYEPVTVSWLDRGDTDEVARMVLALEPAVTALVCATDATAVTVARSLAAFGLKVPGDIAVIGFDGSVEAARCCPPLTTVAQSFAQLGATACEVIADILNGQRVAPGPRLVPVSLVIRQSCGCTGLEAGDRTHTEQLMADLAIALGDDQDQSPNQLHQISAITNLVVGTYQAVRATPDVSDIRERVVSVVTSLCRLARRQRNVPVALGTLRRFGKVFAAHAAAGDRAAQQRIEELTDGLLLEAVTHLADTQGGVPVRYRRQLGHLAITTDVLRRNYRGSRALAWLEETDVRVGYLATWAPSKTGAEVGHEVLEIVGAFDSAGESAPIGYELPVGQFPPEPVLRCLDEHSDSVAYILPVEFDGSAHGLLAVCGPCRTDHNATIDLLNHWTAMLTVALDQERATQELRISQERYELAMDAANAGLWDFDLVTGDSYCTDRWWSLLELPRGRTPMSLQLLLDRTYPADQVAVAQLLDHGSGFGSGDRARAELEHRIVRGEGQYRWVLTRVRSVHDDLGRMTRLVCSMSDITHRKRLEEQLRHDARYDTLTGLPNRVLFIDRLDQVIARSFRQGHYCYAVVFLDLNGFKAINDDLGHLAGDQLLVEVARRLAAAARSGDTAARFGGDEFVVLLDGVSSAQDARQAATRILGALGRPVEICDQVVTVGVSAGMAIGADKYTCVDEVLRDADSAMYRAKRNSTLAGNPSAVVLELR